MDNKNFAFGKENFVLLLAAIVIIIIGFCLMLGGSTTEEFGFNPDIFSTRRIKVAPAIAMAGFLLVIVAILKNNKENKKEDKE